ncbi:DNA polymerase III subunit beta family protein, partial [Bacillus pumilus]
MHHQTSYNLLIPPKTLTHLTTILHHPQHLLTILITQTQLLFKPQNVFFFSTFLHPNYPHTPPLIPHKSKTHVLVNTNEFLQP